MADVMLLPVIALLAKLVYFAAGRTCMRLCWSLLFVLDQFLPQENAS
jgi:hypothetical protein